MFSRRSIPGESRCPSFGKLRIADCGLRLTKSAIRNPKSEIRNGIARGGVGVNARADVVELGEGVDAEGEVGHGFTVSGYQPLLSGEAFRSQRDT